MITQALIATAVNTVSLDQVELPEPQDHEVLVETLYSSISPGTELRCLSGKQGGDATFPFVPGYSMIVRVVQAGPRAATPVGTIAFLMGSAKTGKFSRAWGAHMAHGVCDAGDLQVLPPGIDLVQASVAKMASTPYHGVRLCKPVAGEKVAVIGLGPIGHMAAKLYALAGAHTVACDASAARVELARKAGIDAVVGGKSLREAFAPAFPEGADVVVDCTGAAAVLPLSMQVAREVPWGEHAPAGPKLVVQGSYADAFSVPYNPGFLRELTILMPRSEQNRDRAVIYDMMKRGVLSLASLITEVRSPAEAQRTYDELRTPGSSAMTFVFKWK